MKFQKGKFLHILHTYANTFNNIPLSQIFEDERLNLATGKFEKVNEYKHYEYVTVIDNKGNIIYNNKTSGLPNEVHIPKNIEKLGEEKGLKVIIHNHPNKVPLPSHNDIYKAMTLRAENVVVTTNGKYNSLLINNDRFAIKDTALLNIKATEIQQRFLNLEKDMRNDFINTNHKYKGVDQKSSEFKQGIAKYYQKDENMLPYYNKFNESLPSNMELKLYNKKTNKYI